MCGDVWTAWLTVLQRACELQSISQNFGVRANYHQRLNRHEHIIHMALSATVLHVLIMHRHVYLCTLRLGSISSAASTPPSPSSPAPVHRQACARDAAGVRPAQVHHHGRQVLRLHELAGRLVGQHHLVDDLGEEAGQGTLCLPGCWSRDQCQLVGEKLLTYESMKMAAHSHLNDVKTCALLAESTFVIGMPVQMTHLLLRYAPGLCSVLQLVAHQVWSRRKRAQSTGALHPMRSSHRISLHDEEGSSLCSWPCNAGTYMTQPGMSTHLQQAGPPPLLRPAGGLTRQDVSRAYGIAGDALPGHLQGYSFGEPRNTVLGGIVGTFVRGCLQGWWKANGRCITSSNGNCPKALGPPMHLRQNDIGCAHFSQCTH